MTKKTYRKRKKAAVDELVRLSGFSSRHEIRRAAETMTLEEIEGVVKKLASAHGYVAASKAITKGAYETHPPDQKHEFSKLSILQQLRKGIVGNFRWTNGRLYQWLKHVSVEERAEWHAWAKVVWR